MKTKLGRIAFIIIAFIIVTVSNNSFAQNVSTDEQDLFPFEKKEPQYNNNIGLTGSWFSGVGFHYKRNITPEHAIKAVFFGWRSVEEQKNTYYIPTKSTDIFISFGLEYRYYFLKTRKEDLYVLAGARTWYSEYNNSSSSEINNVNAIGLGIGCDFRWGKHFVVNVEIGFLNKWEVERSWDDRYYHKSNNTFTFGAGAGIGFVF